MTKVSFFAEKQTGQAASGLAAKKQNAIRAAVYNLLKDIEGKEK
jgi:hypothetical protein